MPAHDWTRVDDGIFHDFHLGWVAALQRTFNTGLVRAGYYALGTLAQPVPTLERLGLRDPGSPTGADPVPTPTVVEWSGTVAVAEAPPRVRTTAQASQLAYTERQRTLVIRHISGHRVVALIEIVSAGNKASSYALGCFLDKAVAALRQGIHLLILDLYPPGPRDPQGIHGVLWERLTGEAYERPEGLPLTLAAYSAGMVKTCYVEPVAVGTVLPEMPLFLDPERYVNVPLEATYQASYSGLPGFYRDILER